MKRHECFVVGFAFVAASGCHRKTPEGLPVEYVRAISAMADEAAKLAISDDAMSPVGLGEKEADDDKAAREKAVGHRLRDTPDARFRKVEVELNGQCVLVLWGA